MTTWKIEHNDVIEWARNYTGEKLSIDFLPQIAYTGRCLDERDTGRFAFLNAIIQHNKLLWAKRPLSGGFTSRRSSKQRWQPCRGRFVMSKPCPDCGKPYSGYKKKRCQACYMASKSFFTSCSYCHKEIRLYISKKKEKGLYFCNRDCVNNAKRVGILKGKPRDRVTLTCPGCGKQFERFSNYVEESIRLGRRLVCSKECRKIWIEWDCETCGKHVRKMRKEVAIKHKRRFCSDECASIGNRGEGNTSWRGGYEPYYGLDWQDQRRKARKRDNYTCQDCGTTEAELGQELDVHHKKRFKGFDNFEDANRLDNLIALCHRCHMTLEWQTERRE